MEVSVAPLERGLQNDGFDHVVRPQLTIGTNFVVLIDRLISPQLRVMSSFDKLARE